MKLSIAIEALPKPSLPTVLERLWADRYTGPVVFQFHEGRPLVIEVPVQPTRIVLDTSR